MCGFVHVRSANTKLPVDHGRIVEKNVFLSGARTAVGHTLEGSARKPFGQFLRVGNGCRCTDELWFASVEFANSCEPAKYICQMASEHAAIGMQLVDDNELKIFEQPRPSG